MPASRVELLIRVHKLLALAASSNVHEAAAAAAAAQALIARHQLDELLAAESASDDPADPITDGRAAPLESARRSRRWKVSLAAGLADLNGGVAWVAADDDATRLCFCGRESDRLAVAALFAWLSVRLEWLSATAGPGKGRAWHEAFRVGAAEAIIDRLAARETPAIDEAHRAALVRVEPMRVARAAAVDRFVDAHLRFGKGRQFSVDARGFERGRAAGGSFALPAKP
ncbi:MAG: DUF2786 domain-containing protein [Deltaproteobacteria bacterium]|nr:DUF2786 domain-containing protein [Deltaproteobacteria bacterium]